MTPCAERTSVAHFTRFQLFPFNFMGLFSFTVSIPMFCYGNTIGWISPMTLLQSDKSPKGVPLTDLEISWMASLPYLVCGPATYLMAAIGDRYGRKLGLLLMSGICVVVWLLKLCSMNIWVFLTARCLVGVIMAGSCVTCPTYLKEITEDNIRGALGCWGPLFFTTGCLFAYVIGDMCDYQVVLIVFIVIPAVHFVVVLMMPESPSYLIKQGKEKEASKSLELLRCRRENDFTIKCEIEDLKKEQKTYESEENFIMLMFLTFTYEEIWELFNKWFYFIFVTIRIEDYSNFLYCSLLLYEYLIVVIFLLYLMTDNIIRRAFQIAFIAVLAREFCGAVPVMNFAGDIFHLGLELTGPNLSPNQQAMVLVAVQFCGAILASGVVERTGRRPLLFVTCAISGVSMCLLATWFLFQHLNPPAWIPVFTLCLCIFCDASGLLPISSVIVGEIFSFKYRGTVLATTMSIASIADFFQLLFFKPIIKSIGSYVVFYCFGAMCILTAVYVIFVVPETRNRKLEEIYYDLRTKKEKKAMENRIAN